MKKLRVGVCYDFRNPSYSGVKDDQLYKEVLEQVKWLDQIGADLVWFTEHHFIEDGYLPSWVPVAGAMAAITKNVSFGTDICLMPFNHPIRLAEDLAVLDNISNGRIEVGLGMGYAPHEFKGFGFPVSHRLSLMNEGIEVLQQCFTGERFSYKGKRYYFEDVTSLIQLNFLYSKAKVQETDYYHILDTTISHPTMPDNISQLDG